MGTGIEARLEGQVASHLNAGVDSENEVEGKPTELKFLILIKAFN